MWAIVLTVCFLSPADLAPDYATCERYVVPGGFMAEAECIAAAMAPPQLAAIRTVASRWGGIHGKPAVVKVTCRQRPREA